MAQPSFWLRVTPAYIVENFEEMLKYISDYTPEPDENKDSDYNTTIDNLVFVANNIVERLNDFSIDTKPEWGDIPESKAVRIVAAAILGQNKRKVTDYNLLVALIQITARLYNIPLEQKPGIFNTLVGCATKAHITHIGLTFSDIEPEKYSISGISVRLANINWKPFSNQSALYEGNGSVIFSPTKGISCIPLNYDEISKNPEKVKTWCEVSPELTIANTGEKKLQNDDLTEIYTLSQKLTREQNNVTPSKVKVLKKYESGDFINVRLTKKLSFFLWEAESVDPDYERVSGALIFPPKILGFSREELINLFEPGDVLPVEYTPEKPSPFFLDVEGVEDDFREYMADIAPSHSKAIYLRDYSMGRMWLSEDGLIVNVHKKFNEALPDFDSDYYGMCVNLKIDGTGEDSKGKILINGYYLPESEQIYDNVNPEEFTEGAYKKLARHFADYLKSEFYENDNDKSTEPIPATALEVSTAAFLALPSAANLRTLDTPSRLRFLAMSNALFLAAGSDINHAISQRDISYLMAIAGFSRGESPMSLKFTSREDLANLPKTREQNEIVESLKQYKESAYKINVNSNLIGEQTDQVSDLISASNILLDKIDASEIWRIKKSIASHLGVADVFKEDNLSADYYGVETDNLEFKVSCVKPPVNLQKPDFKQNTFMQAYIILKTVCAFLNNVTGGELLIGVDDKGYASGIDNDLNILFENHLITEKSPDKLMVYIKWILDRGFITATGDVKKNAITAGNVFINSVQSPNGKDLVRIRVNSYPYDMVKILPEYVPEGFKDTFYRSDNTSMPLDKDGLRNIKLKKLQALNREDRNLAILMEAIDKKKQVYLKRYRTEKGLQARTVEPHMLVCGNTALEAYDVVTRKMELFKLSRILELTPLFDDWKYAKYHKTRPVDIFGNMASEGSTPVTLTMKLSDYAMLLLEEEHPWEKDNPTVNVAENTESDRLKYPHKVTLTLFDSRSIERFTAGLPDDVMLP